MRKTLNIDQIALFKEQGYLRNLPVFDNIEMMKINKELLEILKLLRPEETTKEIREWHEESQFLFDICMDHRILDYVEALLGPNFFMWASNFFIKEPHTTETVAWHQDAYYWPLKPLQSLTVWIAFDDVDESNGAMQFLPESHTGDILDHNRQKGEGSSVLDLVVDVTSFDLNTATNINLKCGNISIHDDKLVHSSPANLSNRRRAGFTVRFSPNYVVADLSVNPHFRIYPARGEVCALNPKGEFPKQRYGRLYRKHISIEEAGQKTEAEYWD